MHYQHYILFFHIAELYISIFNIEKFWSIKNSTLIAIEAFFKNFLVALKWKSLSIHHELVAKRNIRQKIAGKTRTFLPETYNDVAIYTSIRRETVKLQFKIHRVSLDLYIKTWKKVTSRDYSVYKMYQNIE